MIANLQSKKRCDVVTERDFPIERIILTRCRAQKRTVDQRMIIIVDVIKIDNGSNPRSQGKFGLQPGAKRRAALGRRSIWFFQAVAVAPTQRSSPAKSVRHCAF